VKRSSGKKASVLGTLASVVNLQRGKKTVASKIPGGGGEVTLNRKGMSDLLTVASHSQRCSGTRMRRVQSAVPGSQLDVLTSGRRARAKVSRGSDFDEANTGTLSRALDLAGGQRGYKVKTNKPRQARAS
jgi:hypothetical protein